MGLAADMGSGAWNFEYTASPTCRKFHRCNARARCIVGPVGCLPCDTEVMTPGGWVRIDEWDGQEILHYDVGEKRTKFLAPVRRIVGSCNLMLMVLNENDGSRMILTHNHRVLYRDGGFFRVKHAIEIVEDILFGREIRIPTGDVSLDGCSMSEDHVFRPGETVIRTVVPPDGKQYCFETVTGFFVVRQNGHVFVTGNSGKSSAIIAGEVMKRAMEQQADPEGRRRTRVVMIRNTYNELTTTTLKTFREWWGFTICTYRSDKPLSAFIRFPMQDGTVVECEVIFLAMDKPEDVGKLRSLEVTWGYINEGSEIVDYEIFDALLERIGRFPKKWKNEKGEKVGGPTWYGACIDTNAPDDEHWIYQKFEVEKPDGFEIFHQPPAVLLKEGSTPENPVWEANKGQREGVPAAENIENIPVGWAYYVNQLAGKSYEKIRVMLCGEYGTVAYGRPVFPEYNDRLHYLPNRVDPKTEKPMEVEVLRGLPILLGIDFGIQYAACIFAQLSPQRQLRAIEELVVKDVGTRDFADLIHGVIAKRYMGMAVKAFGDPCARARDRQTGITDIDLLNECGIPTIAAPTNDPRQRREAVVYFMQRLVGDGQPALVLGSKCPMLRKGFAGRYYYKKISTSGREEIFRPDPVKNEYSHPNDGLQYIATSLLYDHNAAEAAMMASGAQGAFGFGVRQQERPIPSGIDSCTMY